MSAEPAFVFFDTSDRRGCVAVARGQSLVSVRESPPGRGHARDLAQLLRGQLIDAGISIGELAAIGVNIGPGSFTGIRVALATAKAIAYVTGSRLIAIDTFELVAQSLGQVATSVRIITEFQLNGWLVADWTPTSSGEFREGQIQVVSAAETARLANDRVPLIGPGLEKLLRLHASAPRLQPEKWESHPENFLNVMLRKFHSEVFADPFRIEPYYATVSSAEQIWDARQAN